MNQFDIELDLTGLTCPLPLLKTKLCLKSMDKGLVLSVITSDSASYRDFSLYLIASGYTLISYEESNTLHHFLIRK